MSVYTALEIVGFMLLAWAIGGCIGWITRGWRAPDAVTTVDPRLAEVLHQQEAALGRLQADFDMREDLHLRFAVVNEARQQLQDKLGRAEAAARAAQASAAVMKDNLAEVSAARDRLETRLAAVEAERVTLVRSSGRMEALRKRVAGLEAEEAELRAARDARGREIERLQQVITERDQTIAELQGKLADATSGPPPVMPIDTLLDEDEQTARIEALEAALAEARRAEPAAVSESLAAAEARIAELENELEIAERTRRSEVSRARLATQEANRTVESQAARIKDLEGCVDGLAIDTDKAINELREERDAFSSANERLSRENDELQRTLLALRKQGSGSSTLDDAHEVASLTGLPVPKTQAVLDIAERTASGVPPAQDDLEEIRGIGPKFARLLANMRITSFRQIGLLTAADIATIGDALGTFPERITRDDWVGGAQRAFRKKYGQPLEEAGGLDRAAVMERLAENATRATRNRTTSAPPRAPEDSIDSHR